MKGIILAGGTGSRLHPINTTNKHLLPVGNQPMIFYPLDCFLEAGITEILIVTGGPHAEDFIQAINSVDKYKDMSIMYTYQKEPDGIVGALKLAETFIQKSYSAHDSKFMVMLGDNIIDTKEFSSMVDRFKSNKKVNCLVSTQFNNTPQHYGTLKFNKNRKFVERIVEKPIKPPSNTIALGIYGFEFDVFSRIESIEKSKRGEYEITSLLNQYIVKDTVVFHSCESFWYDVGESIEVYNQVCATMVGLSVYPGGWQ